MCRGESSAAADPQARWAPANGTPAGMPGALSYRRRRAPTTLGRWCLATRRWVARPLDGTESPVSVDRTQPAPGHLRSPVRPGGEWASSRGSRSCLHALKAPARTLYAVATRVRRLLRAIIARLLPGAPAGGGVPQAPMPWLEASAPGGSAIPVLRQGEGRPIVIVHGGSGDLTSWAAVAGRLLDQFSVYRYTRPTYRLGPTPRGAEAMATETAAAQISDNEAIESLGVGLDRYAKLAVPALLLGGAKSQSHF